MKALILAAGLGTRLRPLTDAIPKPLVPIGGRPLMWYHLEALRKNGVGEVLVNTHYLPEMIDKFIAEYNEQHPSISVRTAYEKELLGSAGTLKANASYFADEEDFFVIYGDSLTNIDYSRLLQQHRQNNTLATIASYYEAYPESKGIIVYDGDKKISRFIEKPKADQVISHQANAGIYVLSKEIMSHLSGFDSGVIDFGHDLFPHLLAHGAGMHVYEMDEFILDIGSMENYDLANQRIHEIFP